MKKNDPRKVAVDVLVKVDRDGAYSHIALREALQKESLEPRDKAFVTELVYGTIRYQKRLDHIVNSFLKKRNLKPEIRNILRMGAYQILHMDRVPTSAAVNESVKLVHLLRLNSQKGLVNAVLRNVDRNRQQDFFRDIKDPVEKMAICFSHPTWIVSLYVQRFGMRAAEELLTYNNRPGENYVRVNLLKTTADKLREELENRKIRVKNGPVRDCFVLETKTSISALREFREGKFLLQSPPGIMAALALQARKGEQILDCCAAPGGKTFVLAQEMLNQGKVLATDVHEHKIELIKKGASFLGIECVETQRRDWTKQQPDLTGGFDRVLADVPCTGLGVLSRRADSRWGKEKADIERMVILQRQILEQAVKALRSGGILVYSTCTLTAEENEQQRQWLLEQDFSLEPFPIDLESAVFDEKDSKTMQEGFLEILPFRHGLDGFYIAVFQKK